MEKAVITNSITVYKLLESLILLVILMYIEKKLNPFATYQQEKIKPLNQGRNHER